MVDRRYPCTMDRWIRTNGKASKMASKRPLRLVVATSSLDLGVDFHRLKMSSRLICQIDRLGGSASRSRVSSAEDTVQLCPTNVGDFEASALGKPCWVASWRNGRR